MAFPVEDNELFTRFFDGVYNQYQKGYSTADIDQLNPNLALAIPGAEISWDTCFKSK